MGSKRLEGKVAVVTGSSSGVGRAIALAYAQEGAVLACADLRSSMKTSDPSESKLDTHDLINQSGGKAIYIQTDVTISAQMQAMVAKTVEAFGRLDVVVNNAGIGPPKSARLHETADEDWEKVIKVNSTSVFLGCKYAIAQMLEQEPHASGHRGWIVNISSIYSMVAGPRACAYAASKGAVSSLTRQIAVEYAAERIHCNAVCPGFTRTALLLDEIKDPNIWAMIEEKHPLGGVGDTRDVARAAVVLASDDAAWITGVNLPVDGGFTAQ